MPKKKQKHFRKRKRDAFTLEFSNELQSTMLNPSTKFSARRNCIVIFILQGCGLRCNETREFTIGDIKQLVTKRALNIVESKTLKKREIFIYAAHAATLGKALELFVGALLPKGSLSGKSERFYLGLLLSLVAVEGGASLEKKAQEHQASINMTNAQLQILEKKFVDA